MVSFAKSIVRTRVGKFVYNMDLSEWKRFKRSGNYRRKVRKHNTELATPNLTGTSSSVLDSEPGASSANTIEINEGSAVGSVLDSDSEENEYDFDIVRLRLTLN